MENTLDKIKNILLIVLTVACIALIMSTTCANKKAKTYENNINALRDTVEVLESKNGELAYAKQALILEKNQLEEYLGISKKEVKELENQLNSSLAYIAKLEGYIKIDTVEIRDTVTFNNDTVNIHFSYNDKWTNLDGETKYFDSTSTTRLNELSMDVPLKLGISEENRILASSENPYVSFTSIDAAVIEGTVSTKKDKRWGIGPFIGVSLNGGYGYGGNPISLGGCFSVGFSVGISVHYSIFQW